MSERYDVLIKNSLIVDDAGKPAFRGNIGIKGEINWSGLVTCPGFIDPHSHADTTILRYPLAENLVMQGVTTFLGGNCSISSTHSKTSVIHVSRVKIFGLLKEAK